MATIKQRRQIAAIKSMSVLDLAELVDALRTNSA